MIDRLKRLAADPRLPWVLIGVGIFLRLVHYLQAFSLSVDESHLTLNVLARSYAQLTEPLGDRQGAPLGYLLLLRTAINWFGDSEYALRLVALICGIISLFLFRSLASRYLEPTALSLAVGLFAVADFLIFYSAQVKQYSGDVMCALVLYLVHNWVRKHSSRWWPILLYGVVGALALWLSHAAVFIVGGLGLSYFIFDVLRAPHRRSFGVVLAFAICGANFLLIYWLSLRDLTSHEWLLDYWKDDFMPLPPRTLGEVQWFVVAFLRMFTKTLGFSLQGICALTFLVGVYVDFRKQPRRLANLVLPILLALAASGLQKYPFTGRLLLFTAPALLLLMAQGTAAILTAARSLPVVGVTLVGLLFLHPVMWAGFHLLHSRVEEDIKPVMEHLHENWRPGDVVYVYYRAVPAFSYYSKRYGFSLPDCCIKGIDSRFDWDGYDRDLAQLRGRPRVWIIFSHIYRWVNVDDEDLFKYLLGHSGVALDKMQTNRAAIYLYDLSPSKSPPVAMPQSPTGPGPP